MKVTRREHLWAVVNIENGFMRATKWQDQEFFRLFLTRKEARENCDPCNYTVIKVQVKQF